MKGGNGARHGVLRAQRFSRGLRLFQWSWQTKCSSSELCPTSGLPLGVHPCLTQEALAQGPSNPNLGYADTHDLMPRVQGSVLPVATPENRRRWGSIRFAADLQELLRHPANPKTTLRRVAVMLSKELRTPWMFMQFEARSLRGVFESPVRLQLAVIPVLDPHAQQVSETAARSSKRTSSGGEDSQTADRASDDADRTARQELQRSGNRAMKNFEERRFFVVPRSQGVSLGGQFSGSPTSDAELSSARLAKRPKPFADSLDIFLRVKSHFQQQRDYERLIQEPKRYNVHMPKSIEITGQRNIDLMRLASRIENPLLNNDFSTDCASCHFSSLEKWHVEGDFDAGKPSDALSMNTEQMSRLLAASPLSPIDVTREAMPELPGVTPATAAAYRVISDVFLSVYVTNQFSIYRDWPQVSNRVANESGVAAYLINQWYLKGARAHPFTCDPIKLQRCLLLREKSPGGLALTWMASDMNQNGQCFEPELGICRQDSGQLAQPSEQR